MKKLQRTIWKRKGLVSGVAVLTSFIAFTVNRTPFYTAQASIRVPVGQAGSQAILITSATVLESAARKVNLIRSGITPERAVAELAMRIRTSVRDSDVVIIQVAGDSAIQAADAAKAVAASYLEAAARERERTNGLTAEALRKKLASETAQVEKAARALADLRRRHAIPLAMGPNAWLELNEKARAEERKLDLLRDASARVAHGEAAGANADGRALVYVLDRAGAEPARDLVEYILRRSDPERQRLIDELLKPRIDDLITEAQKTRDDLDSKAALVLGRPAIEDQLTAMTSELQQKKETRSRAQAQIDELEDQRTRGGSTASPLNTPVAVPGVAPGRYMTALLGLAVGLVLGCVTAVLFGAKQSTDIRSVQRGTGGQEVREVLSHTDNDE